MMVEELRKQYHFRRCPDGGFFAWDVHRLIEMVADIVPTEVSIVDISEVDENYWEQANAEGMTPRSVMEHAKLIMHADLSYPIILSSDGRIMDGMHRVLKALYENRDTVLATRFTIDPTPDHVGVMPDDLSY